MSFWKKGIPPELLNEVRDINRFTREKEREISLTVCKKPDRERLFVSNHAKGTVNSTPSEECDVRFGESDRIGDFHTHPYTQDTIGTLPSPSDLASTLYDSMIEKRAQISCITNHETPLIECYKPKKVPDRKKIAKYNQAIEDNMYGEHGFLMDNVPKDFEFAHFEPSGERVHHPSAEKIVKAALGASVGHLRKDITDFERAGFCQYVQTFTHPHDDAVAGACIATLRKKTIPIVGVEYSPDDGPEFIR